MITFKDYYDLERSMAFEGIFEEDLRLDKNEKKDLLGHCVTSYMFYEGFIAGEIYSVDVETLIKLEEGGMEDIGDIRYTSSKTAYIYSVAILPEWQGRGLSKILIAYHLGQLQISGFSQVVAHSTARAMDKVFKWFCFYFLQDGQHEKWYGTDRVARFC